MLLSIDEKEELRLRNMILSSTESEVPIKMIETFKTAYSHVAVPIRLDLVNEMPDSEVRKAALDTLQGVKGNL